MAALTCGLLLGVALLQILLRPIRLSNRSIFFDAILVALCFIGLFPGINEIVGIVSVFGLIALTMGMGVFAIPLVLIAFVYFLFRKRPTQSEDAPQSIQFSLAEGIAMVLAGSSLPLVMAALGLGNPAANLLVMMCLLPLLYLRAWHRLNAHQVPYSDFRLAFVAAYPYLVFGVIYLSLYATLTVTLPPKTEMEFFKLPAAILFAGIVLFAVFVTLNLQTESKSKTLAR